MNKMDNEWTPVSSGELPDEEEIVQVTYIGCTDGKPYCDCFAHRKRGYWLWSLDDTDVEVEITAWRHPGEPYLGN